MEMPPLIKEAIEVKEAEISAILQEQSDKFTAVNEAQAQTIAEQAQAYTEQAQAIAELKAILESEDLDDAAALSKIQQLESTNQELESKNQQLEASQVDVEEIASAIKNIHRSPVSDAVMETVINNPDIPTPQIVADAPEVAPEVVQSPEVVQAAIEALVQADAESVVETEDDGMI
jgi:seryl-tRNA synthetase